MASGLHLRDCFTRRTLEAGIITMERCVEAGLTALFLLLQPTEICWMQLARPCTVLMETPVTRSGSIRSAVRVVLMLCGVKRPSLIRWRGQPGGAGLLYSV